MCGIGGIWGAVTAERLTAIADRLRHRGPDEDAFWSDQRSRIGFAHCRLSIIDLEGGQQPFTDETGRIVTICNGEIYNYRELREELIARGHRFRSQSDAEVIVHLYEEEGPNCVSQLRGMFAIAIWDGPRQQLVLVRDRVGKKPLYFSEAHGEFVFASEIKGVIAGMREAPTLDDQAVVDYLGFGVVPAPSTIYRTVRSVNPGDILIIRKRRVASSRKYWQLTMQPKRPIARAEAVERLDQLLHDAVRLRLRSDVPVGCFLSGGIDSGLITAIAAKQYGQRLTTLTVGFEDGVFDERPLARQVAQRYGTDHHELLIRSHVTEDLETIVRAYDQPYGDSSAIPSFYVAREARRHVKVILNGDGGDEVAAGYRRTVAAWLTQRLWWQDDESGRAMWRRLGTALPAPRGFRSPFAFAHRLIKGMAMPPMERYIAWSVDGMNERSLRALCGASPVSKRCWLDSVVSSDRLAWEVLAPTESLGPVDRMLAADFATMLPNDLLVKIDIATMAHGLEARSPLLDHVLIDEVSRFPESVKLDGFRTKPLLRDLARRYVPQSVCRAPKRGFEVPLVRWLGGELRDLAEDVILSREGLLARLFDRKALECLLRGQTGLGPARWSRHVWLLLMLGMWDRCVYRDKA